MQQVQDLANRGDLETMEDDDEPPVSSFPSPPPDPPKCAHCRNFYPLVPLLDGPGGNGNGRRPRRRSVRLEKRKKRALENKADQHPPPPPPPSPLSPPPPQRRKTRQLDKLCSVCGYYVTTFSTPLKIRAELRNINVHYAALINSLLIRGRVMPDATFARVKAIVGGWLRSDARKEPGRDSVFMDGLPTALFLLIGDPEARSFPSSPGRRSVSSYPPEQQGLSAVQAEQLREFLQLQLDPDTKVPTSRPGLVERLHHALYCWVVDYWAILPRGWGHYWEIKVVQMKYQFQYCYANPLAQCYAPDSPLDRVYPIQLKEIPAPRPVPHRLLAEQDADGVIDSFFFAAPSEEASAAQLFALPRPTLDSPPSTAGRKTRKRKREKNS